MQNDKKKHVNRLPRAIKNLGCCDVANFAFYIPELVEKVLYKTVEYSYAWPGSHSKWKTPEEWFAYLTSIADDLKAYREARDDPKILFPNKTQQRKADRAMKRFGAIALDLWY